MRANNCAIFFMPMRRQQLRLDSFVCQESVLFTAHPITAPLGHNLKERLQDLFGVEGVSENYANR